MGKILSDPSSKERKKERLHGKEIIEEEIKKNYVWPIYIYIYIYRERERERKKKRERVWVCVCVWVTDREEAQM